jgi:hypothetical protein
MRRIERIRGRSDDMLIIRGVNVFPSQIEAVLGNNKTPLSHHHRRHRTQRSRTNPTGKRGRLVLRCPLVVIILPISVSLRGRGIGTFPPPEQRAPPKFKREWPRCLTTTREHGPV